MDDQAYTLANTEGERARLARQAVKLRPITERLFAAAGIGTGMQVLDVGCGAGDVSALVAELVGPDGEVVGCDRDPAQVRAAAGRWPDARNLRFEVADISQPPPGPFDAVVGRLVLMYQPDMAASIAQLASVLRPGGVIAFVETSLGGDAPPPTWPAPGPLSMRIGQLINRAFGSTGVQVLAGLRLPASMRAAGLEPQLPYESGSILYEGREAAEMQAGLFRSMVPALQAAGVDLADINVDGLADELEHEQEQPRIVAVGPLIGVWAVLNAVAG